MSMERKDPKPLAAIGFGTPAVPLLEQLQQAFDGLLIRWPHAEESPEVWLSRRWPEVSAILAIGACGMVMRLVAPLLGDKRTDPAVVVLDPQGRWVVPLLGGHGAGGEALARELDIYNRVHRHPHPHITPLYGVCKDNVDGLLRLVAATGADELFLTTNVHGSAERRHSYSLVAESMELAALSR
jgi:hypothetical protein